MAASVPIIDYQHSVTSRPYIESCQVAWPRNDLNDRVHSAAPFSVNKNPRDFYVIHPDWSSEALYVPPRQPADPKLVRRPWLWEFPRARELFYPSKQQQLRARVLRDMHTQAKVPRLHSDKHYQVKHNSPWFVNNRREVIDANPLEKVRPMPGSDGYHLRPWNNARDVLQRELQNPVLPDIRARTQPDSVSADPMSPEQVREFRCKSRQYMTACDWS